jgi:hypothetical protein
MAAPDEKNGEINAMNVPLKIGLASVLAIASVAPAMAQNAYQPTQQYQRDMQTYQEQRADYADRQADYANKQQDYREARAAYERRRDAYIRAQIDYDRRYGRGSYVRVYGPAPVWSETTWRSASNYGSNTAYIEPCRRTNNSAVTAGVVGALIGAALGSNVAANGRGTEGAVLGGVVGGGIGAAVGHAHDVAKCDNSGLYYSYNDTIAYRESSYDRMRNSGRYSYNYYATQRCRLAPAPYADDTYRYVRVCPDRSGRYRVTG